MFATMIGSLLLVSAAIAGAQSSAPEESSSQPAPSRSQTAPLDLVSDEKIDLAKLKCWDAVTLNEQDRGFTMVLLVGFVIGQKNESLVSARDVQVATVRTMQDCVDTPDALVLDVLKSKLN